jgi:signal transduction histidine kinase
MLMIVTLLRSYSEPDYFTVGMIIQFFYILVVYLICPFTWTRQLAYAGLFSLACLVIWEYRIEYTTDFYRLIPSYPCANLLGALLARQRHTQERNLFASERRRGHQLDLVDQLRRQQAEILDLLTHELRQPLASLAAQGELILRLQEPKAIHTIASRIVRISTDAANIIREWIDHDRTALTTVSPSGPKEAVQLLEVIQEVVGHVRREHPELNVAIQVSSVPMIVIDRRVLIIAIHNILINAARYAHSRRGVLIQSRIHSNKVTLRIRDFGPGLTAAEQGDLFLKHVRLNPSRSVGTGVGLYLVRELLNRCGARIRVQSVVGRGTAFIIEISRVV